MQACLTLPCMHGCSALQAQRVKAQRDMEEVKGVTFHPEISRHAQTIWGPHEVGSVPVWQRLSKGQLQDKAWGVQMPPCTTVTHMTGHHAMPGGKCGNSSLVQQDSHHVTAFLHDISAAAPAAKSAMTGAT